MPAAPTRPPPTDNAPAVRLVAGLGALFGATGVAMGAFAAHALKAQLAAPALATIDTAVRYQMLHALALWACAFALHHWPGAASRAAAACMTGGTLLFCGSLYALAFGAPRLLAWITPVGGLLLIVGWLLLAWTACRARPA